MKTSTPVIFIAAALLLIVASHILSHYRIFAASIICDILVLALLAVSAILQGKADRERKESRNIKRY